MIPTSERKQIILQLYKLIKESEMFSDYPDEHIKEAAAKSEMKAYNSASSKEEYLKMMKSKFDKVTKKTKMANKKDNLTNSDDLKQSNVKYTNDNMYINGKSNIPFNKDSENLQFKMSQTPYSGKEPKMYNKDPLPYSNEDMYNSNTIYNMKTQPSTNQVHFNTFKNGRYDNLQYPKTNLVDRSFINRNAEIYGRNPYTEFMNQSKNEKANKHAHQYSSIYNIQNPSMYNVHSHHTITSLQESRNPYSSQNDKFLNPNYARSMSIPDTMAPMNNLMRKPPLNKTTSPSMMNSYKSYNLQNNFEVPTGFRKPDNSINMQTYRQETFRPPEVIGQPNTYKINGAMPKNFVYKSPVQEYYNKSTNRMQNNNIYTRNQMQPNIANKSPFENGSKSFDNRPLRSTNGRNLNLIDEDRTREYNMNIGNRINPNLYNVSSMKYGNGESIYRESTDALNSRTPNYNNPRIIGDNPRITADNSRLAGGNTRNVVNGYNPTESLINKASFTNQEVFGEMTKTINYNEESSNTIKNFRNANDLQGSPYDLYRKNNDLQKNIEPQRNPNHNSDKTCRPPQDMFSNNSLRDDFLASNISEDKYGKLDIFKFNGDDIKIISNEFDMIDSENAFKKKRKEVTNYKNKIPDNQHSQDVHMVRNNFENIKTSNSPIYEAPANNVNLKFTELDADLREFIANKKALSVTNSEIEKLKESLQRSQEVVSKVITVCKEHKIEDKKISEIMNTFDMQSRLMKYNFYFLTSREIDEMIDKVKLYYIDLRKDIDKEETGVANYEESIDKICSLFGTLKKKDENWVLDLEDN